MFNLSSSVEYSLLFLGYLRGKKAYVSLNDIVEELKMPRRFLARIAAILAKEGIVESKEGKTGGYKITNKINRLNFYDFLRIFDQDKRITKCLDGKYKCSYEKVCQHKDFVEIINTKFMNELKKYKLSQVLKNYA